MAWGVGKQGRHLREVRGQHTTAPRPKQKIICSAKRPTRVATSLLDVFHAIVISKQFVCTK